MRRTIALLSALAAVLAVAATARAHFDHPVPSFSEPAPLSSAVNAGGENASWELVTTIATGNPHSDLDFFTSKGDTYASVGTLAAGPNAGGQTIVRLTENGEVKPAYVTGHPSASCVTTTTAATGLQHDVEATPKGDALPQQINPYIAKGDAQLLVESTDGTGRCHDQGAFGQNAPNGGLEIIDITDPTAPKELALTVHTGQAHTVNVDPKRPHIAFDVTQDNVTINPDGSRSNDTAGNALDGFEIVDMSSCMNFPAGTPIEVKRDRCRPQVYRYRYPNTRVARSHTFPNQQGCHETEIYADDRLVCAGIDATAVFDLSGAFDDRGTPNDYTDDKPRGTPLPCRVRGSSSAGGAFGTGAKVTDCHNGGTDDKPQSLIVSEWLKIGSPSLEGVEWVGTVPHMGFGATADIANTKYDATEDIVAAHESEITQSGRFVLTTDERGGGTVPPGASCDVGNANTRGNGGIHAFPISSFTTNPPGDAESAWKLWARDSKGEKAIYRAPTRTGAAGDFCTSHVFQQIPGQNRIFMGWYTQGTQVVDFTENANGTLDFKEVGYFVPENANTWVSHIFKVERNQDGTFTYYGATGDGILPGTGRGAIDIYKVTLPPAPTPRGAARPSFPPAQSSDSACARTSAFDRVRVRPRGRGLRYSVVRRGSGRERVHLLRHAGKRLRVVQRLGTKRPLRVRRDGTYIVRFRAKAPDGRTDTRVVGVVRRNGRWRVLPPIQRVRPCGLLRSVTLARAAVRERTAGVNLRLTQAAQVVATVRRGRKVVSRTRARTYQPGTRRMRVRVGRAAGAYRVTVRAQRPGLSDSATVTAQRR